MFEETIHINLSLLGATHKTTLLGRRNGMYARTILKMDMVERWVKEDTSLTLEIQFPDEVFIVNDSFLMNFLEDTYKYLGYDTFVARVKFVSSNELLDVKELYNDFIDHMKRMSR